MLKKKDELRQKLKDKIAQTEANTVPTIFKNLKRKGGPRSSTEFMANADSLDVRDFFRGDDIRGNSKNHSLKLMFKKYCLIIKLK